jgi:hypothetical protein
MGMPAAATHSPKPFPLHPGLPRPGPPRRPTEKISQSRACRADSRVDVCVCVCVCVCVFRNRFKNKRLKMAHPPAAGPRQRRGYTMLSMITDHERGSALSLEYATVFLSTGLLRRRRRARGRRPIVGTWIHARTHTQMPPRPASFPPLAQPNLWEGYTHSPTNHLSLHASSSHH